MSEAKSEALVVEKSLASRGQRATALLVKELNERVFKLADELIKEGEVTPALLSKVKDLEERISRLEDEVFNGRNEDYEDLFVSHRGVPPPKRSQTKKPK
jgi:polyhydroxyalkanoate synthesis regulator phasin